MPTFVLIHSPLVGPLTWTLVRDELQRRGVDAVVPALWEGNATSAPYWERHVATVTRALQPVPADRPLVLVGHSGTGPLLPAAGERAGRPIAAYLFVDADIPLRHGMSRLDLFDSPEAARQIRGSAENGFVASPWRSEEILRAAGVEDKGLRQRFAAELPQVPMAVYEELLPVSDGWPDAPCGYLGFTQSKATYRRSIDRAQSEGWPYIEVEGGHFHMLVEPSAVADALLNLAQRTGTVVRTERR